MRKASALIVAIGMVAALTACSSSNGFGDCEPRYPSGDASSVVEAPGEFGSDPRIDFPTPIIAHTTQMSEILAGDGERLQAGQPVRAEVSILNGANGDELQATAHDGQGVITMVGESSLPTVGRALECVTVGSRIAVATSAQDGHNSEPIPDFNVAANDSYIFVIDVLQAFLAKADGAAQLAKAGDPSVVLAPDGTPGITVPREQAPEDLVVSLLKKGDGREVEQGSLAVVQYTGVLWDNNEVFDSSWANGAAAVFPMVEGQVIKGFAQSLIGQKVGSQVLVTVPPELGYGEQGSGAVPANATLVFVVDILGIIDQG